MLSKLAYPLFGLVVLIAYIAATMGGRDVGATAVSANRIPKEYLGGAYENAPLVWRSSLHGPGPAPKARASASRTGGSYYGGWGGGK